jgi:ABC-2 type transport system permease protein
VRPVEVMIAKIVPYIGIGNVQVRLILAVSIAVFQLLIRKRSVRAPGQAAAR